MADLSKLRFLIVDDNPHMLKIVRTLLNGFGVDRILEAENAAKAIEHARNEHIDIVILDFQMEDMNGIELIGELRNEAVMENPLVPIIMLTAYAEKSRVIEARDAGVNEFCAKPITARDLFRKIAAVVDRSRAFVRTRSFFGPDRRRHDPAAFKGTEKRSDDPATPNVA